MLCATSITYGNVLAVHVKASFRVHMCPHMGVCVHLCVCLFVCVCVCVCWGGRVGVGVGVGVGKGGWVCYYSVESHCQHYFNHIVAVPTCSKADAVLLLIACHFTGT